MKKLILVLIATALIAVPAFAQRIIPSPGPGRLVKPPVEHSDIEGEPVNPVPEPGTMALASMGLMALGAAARKRRGK